VNTERRWQDMRHDSIMFILKTGAPLEPLEPTEDSFLGELVHTEGVMEGVTGSK
jgi:hypothetical protein